MTDATQFFDMWRKQLEESTQAWTRMVSQATPPTQPPDPMAFWRPVLDRLPASYHAVAPDLRGRGRLHPRVPPVRPGPALRRVLLPPGQRSAAVARAAVPGA